jgi:antitoxin VapB
MRGTECEIDKGLTSRPHGSERDDRSWQLQSRRRVSRAAQCGQQSGQVTDEIVAMEGRKMGLHIKNREAHQMAEELSKLTGESMTTAVTIALRERLERVRQQQGLGLADRLLAIGKDCAARLKEPFRSADHGDLLYDERGLPR